MIKHRIFFTSLFIITFLSVSAQDKKKWKTGIAVGQSSDNKFTKSLPATFIATYPSDPSINNSYSINGFVGFNFYKGPAKYSDTKVSLFYELHKNTLISKKQNLYQYGVSMANTFDLRKNNPLYMLTDISLRYSEDKIENKKGVQYLGYLSVRGKNNYECNFLNYLTSGRIFPGNRRTNIDTEGLTASEIAMKLKDERKVNWSKKLHPSDYIQIEHNHAIGIVHIGYEDLTLFSASFGVDIYPLSGLLYSAFGKYQILKFHYAISYRNNLNNYAGQLFVGSLIKKGVSLNYAVDKKTAFSFGYEHSDGGNPLKGLDDNTFGQLTIGAKVNL